MINKVPGHDLFIALSDFNAKKGDRKNNSQKNILI